MADWGVARAAIELWFDFSCPYAYLASRRARHLPFPVDWRPMLLGGVFRGTGAGDGPMATLSATCSGVPTTARCPLLPASSRTS